MMGLLLERSKALLKALVDIKQGDEYACLIYLLQDYVEQIDERYDYLGDYISSPVCDENQQQETNTQAH